MSGSYEWFPCYHCGQGTYKVYIPDDYTGEPGIRSVCHKSECQQKERELKQKIKDQKEKQKQEQLKKNQEQNENYQKLKKEIEDIVADDFTYSEDDTLQDFFTDWKQKLTNESETWENINSEQVKNLKKCLSQKREEINKLRNKQEQEEKFLISWDNFLRVIEELKENPDSNLTILPEWEKMINADKELAKIVQKITKEGEKVKEKLKKANKEYEIQSIKESFRKKVNHWVDSYHLDMKHKEISLNDKDFNVLDDLVAEICEEQKPGSQKPDKKNNSPADKKRNHPPPTQHDINKKYQNDTQKDEVNNSTNWQNSKEQQLAKEFLKKIIEAEIYLERKQSNPQIVSELLRLKKEHPSIYKLLNKEERIDKAIAKLKELELVQKGQKNDSRQNNNPSFLLHSLIIGGIVIFLIGLIVIIKRRSKKSSNRI